MHYIWLVLMTSKHFNPAILNFKQTLVFLNFSKLVLDGIRHPEVDKTSC